MTQAKNPIRLLSKREDFSKEVSERVELIEQLLSIGTALSGKQNLGDLLNFILAKSREITCSDAGSVFLIDKNESMANLIFKVAQNDSLPNVSFNEFAVPLSPRSLAGYVALTGQSLNIPDAYELLPHLPYQLDRSFDRDFGYRTRSILVLPMQDQEGEIIGVIQLLNRKIDGETTLTLDNVYDVTVAYSEWEERIIRSLASQAAISIERNNLQASIENLFEGFVTASIQAIESRDPTTAGHSERVAQLTLRLAEEVNGINQGQLKLIHFHDRQLQEIRYAALLHDFGKIGVPELILNKRQKLYPEQMQVLKSRFSLVQRTLEMSCAQEKFRYLVEHPHHHGESNHSCEHCRYLEQMEDDLNKAINQLKLYWDLVNEFNEPEAIANRKFESLSDELLEKVDALSQYNYIDTDGQVKPLVTPEEMEQLLVPRGNLNRAERLAIESHVSHSFEFLKQIPWTPQLKAIPMIAYGHHEKLDGTGYPLGLKKAEIPIQTQMMSVADIYDALTAADRPYKKSLPVEVGLRILKEEAERDKINTDLVEVFIQKQVFTALGHSL
ncbi:MAG: GAF domain-containing protein [Synechococcaceae cyanobacterium RL_1_2]|nr:GAF domain-containing protein [Synechococcaceae cyanobacterium RL_1_2]